MPECEIYKISLAEGLTRPTAIVPRAQHVLTDMLAAKDGNQELFFYWLDPIDAIKRYIAKSQYSGKLYTKFEPGTPFFRDIERAFGSRVNSGMVFEAAQLIDTDSSPVLAVFFSDASFSGQHMTHHPIYSTLVSLF